MENGNSICTARGLSKACGSLTRIQNPPATKFAERPQFSTTKLITFGYFQLDAVRAHRGGCLAFPPPSHHPLLPTENGKPPRKDGSVHPLTAFKAQAATNGKKYAEIADQNPKLWAQVSFVENCGRLAEVTSWGDGGGMGGNATATKTPPATTTRVDKTPESELLLAIMNV